MKAVSVVITFY